MIRIASQPQSTPAWPAGFPAMLLAIVNHARRRLLLTRTKCSGKGALSLNVRRLIGEGLKITISDDDASLIYVRR